MKAARYRGQHNICSHVCEIFGTGQLKRQRVNARGWGRKEGNLDEMGVFFRGMGASLED